MTTKVLVITNLYPNSNEPGRGVFVRQQVNALRASCEVKVIAPLPWIPAGLGFMKNNSHMAVQAKESIDGIDVYHPRWFVIPKILRSAYGFLLFVSLYFEAVKIRQEFDFDVIDAQWAYPDGFAAVLLGKVLRKPVIVHALGCDINQYTRFFLRRKMIVWALRNASRVLAVSVALKEAMESLGVDGAKIIVLPNGVDLEVFKPLDKRDCRVALGLPQDTRIVLYAGRFEEEKGVDYLVEALHVMETELGRNDALLVLVGKGGLEGELRARAKAFGIDGKIIFAGNVNHAKLPVWMNACDVFSLPSKREGMPNVVLEAAACRKFVVASRVGGVPEIVCSEQDGILVSPEDPHALAEALDRALRSGCDICAPVQRIISWEENAKRLSAELQEATHTRGKRT